MGLAMSKSLYYYPHYSYVYLRYLIEYYYPIANNEEYNEVYTDIFVGNISTAYNKAKLKELGVTHVVTAISGMRQIYPDEFDYHLVDVLDIKKENLLPVFEKVCQFMDKALEDGGKVYVHCMCGVSRSVSMVCAYLSYKHNLSPHESLELIRNNRPKAKPNVSFLNQLENYHCEIHKPDDLPTLESLEVEE